MRRIRDVVVENNARTPLEMMLSTSFHGGRKIYILARDLVEAGATPTKLVLTKAVLSSDINLLKVCLRRGETPNRIPHFPSRMHSDFDSILSLALRRYDTDFLFLILRHGEMAGWDEIAAAGSLVGKEFRDEDVSLVSKVVRTLLSSSHGVPTPPPGSLSCLCFGRAQKRATSWVYSSLGYTTIVRLCYFLPS